ncbi:MAG: transporter [Ginsengibacter sp.]
MKTILIIVLITLAVQETTAQKSEKIESDRPGKAQTSYVIPNQMLQVETGFDWLKRDKNMVEIQHPEIVMKYGLFRRLELRTRILTQTDKFQNPSYSQSGLEPIEIGLKALVTEGKGLIPHTSLTAQFGIPGFASKAFIARKVFPKLRLNLENDLTNKSTLEYNVAAEWDGYGDNPEWMIAVSPHFELGEKWQIFVEAFSSMQQNKEPETGADGGVSYWLTNNVMIDLSGGVGISNAAPKRFANIGFSFRL